MPLPNLQANRRTPERMKEDGKESWVQPQPISTHDKHRRDEKHPRRQQNRRLEPIDESAAKTEATVQAPNNNQVPRLFTQGRVNQFWGKLCSDQ